MKSSRWRSLALRLSRAVDKMLSSPLNLSIGAVGECGRLSGVIKHEFGGEGSRPGIEIMARGHVDEVVIMDMASGRGVCGVVSLSLDGDGMRAVVAPGFDDAAASLSAAGFDVSYHKIEDM